MRQNFICKHEICIIILNETNVQDYPSIYKNVKNRLHTIIIILPEIVLELQS